MQVISQVEAKAKIEAYCAYQDRCIDEVKKKLVSWGLTVLEINELIDYLHETRFLDEERFVFAFVSGKFRYKKWGKIKIRQHLKLKKVDLSLIQRGLDSLDGDLYFDTILDLIQKKDKALKDKKLNIYEWRNKVMRFVLSKGFEMDIVQDAIDFYVKQS